MTSPSDLKLTWKVQKIITCFYLKNMQVTTHLKLAFFQTGEFPGIEKSSMSVYLGSRYALYLLTQQTNV